MARCRPVKGQQKRAGHPQKSPLPHLEMQGRLVQLHLADLSASSCLELSSLRTLLRAVEFAWMLLKLKLWRGWSLLRGLRFRAPLEDSLTRVLQHLA